ncbi:MAG TPA: hypothetical protein VND99_02955 [Candidatus Acidoferrales bacterium]|nr:hypothetical protein [Candidatus Acidoferrales bacterium]
MKYTSSNPCTRCGKERILLREWKESVPTLSGTLMEITRSENICPDPECQAIVQLELTKQKEKRDKMKQEREDRITESKKKKSMAKMIKDNN